MAPRDPVSAYTAAHIVEAQLVRDLLLDAGIEAHVIEDSSQVGEWLGIVNEIHEPEVWIDRSDADRAEPVLAAYKAQAVEHAPLAAETDAIAVVCEECGQATLFPAEQAGSVQKCPECNAYVDVGNPAPFDDWAETPPDDEPGA